jgi:hypothetical protein
MITTDDEGYTADDAAEDGMVGAQLLAEAWQGDPEGTTGLPVGCLVGGYYLPRPKDQRGGAVVLQGNDCSW